MAGKIGLVCYFLLRFSHSLLAVNGDPGREQVEQELGNNCTKEFQSYQMETIAALKQMFDEEHMCSPCTRLEKEVKDGRGKQARLEREINDERAKVARLEAKYDAAIAADEPRIYFATWKQGLKRFSLATSEVKTVAGHDGRVFTAVAYDWVRAKIYWSSTPKIFRANENGTGRETVLNTTTYGEMQALAFDWVTGNIYVASVGGFILACDGRSKLLFPCATVLKQEGQIFGIALNPIEGTMYWSSPPFSIKKAGMDGSSPVTVASASDGPLGIAIDIISKRLYWATYHANKIESTDLEGTKNSGTSEVKTVVQRPGGSKLWGIAVHGDRLYWSTAGSYKLESSSKNGTDIRLHHTEKNSTYHIDVVPNFNLPTGRTNHCAGYSCAKVCVLTATSFRCIE